MHRERRAGRAGSLFFWRDRTREVDREHRLRNVSDHRTADAPDHLARQANTQMSVLQAIAEEKIGKSMRPLAASGANATLQ